MRRANRRVMDDAREVTAANADIGAGAGRERLFRFFAPAARGAQDVVVLPDEEAVHLTRVLRLTRGAAVRVFDGRGLEWTALVEDVQRQRVTVRLVRPASPQAEPRVALTLAVAVLKGDKMDDVVRDAVMLGAAGVQPLLSRRTEISAAALARSGRVARWQRIAVSSAKQCGRAVVPPVAEPVTFDAVLTRPGLKILLVEPERGAGGIALSEVPDAEAATLIVGPEGGWTDDEIERARAAGCMLLTLGPRTLRADAVPIVAMTALRVRWGDL